MKNPTTHRRTSQESDERFLARLLGSEFLLWSPNVQAEAFRQWDRIFATRRIRRGDQILPLDRFPDEPEIRYEDRGVEKGVAMFMEDEYISGLLILKNGRIALERYSNGLTHEDLWQSSSMVKSLASCLIGAAVQDGYIADINDPIRTYLPELAGTAYDQVTIQHLLTMSSGIEWSENTDDLHSDVIEHYIKPIAARRPGAIVEYLKTRQLAVDPGTQFYYNSADVFLLGEVLTRACGCSVADYCSEKIWMPMGMEQDGYFTLESDGGCEVLGSCSGACLRDYARWGLLMLGDGVFNGVRILPENWVARATEAVAPDFSFNFEGIRGLKSPDAEHQGYGYLWWVGRDGSFQARGSFGQWIHVDPTEQIVAVMLSAVPRVVYAEEDHGTSHSGSPVRNTFIQAAIEALR